MSRPYHLLAVCGNFVFAASGSDIYSLNSNLEQLSSWKHPVRQEKGVVDPSLAPQESPAPDSPAPEGPPTKRRRVEEPSQEPETTNGNGADAEPQTQKGRRRLKKEKKAAQKPTNPPQERPFVQSLLATTDGRHIVAITGSDKTIWVFEHDGAGHLTQLSQRPMPKRPCSIALTPDNQTILSADNAPPTPAPLSRSSTPSGPQPFKPQATELTVHTRRNLKALENQKISLQLNKPSTPDLPPPAFTHTLLLGHVSMLTAVLVATHPTTHRDYILTADRDEHIRVSRGPAQAHVIETFCLGHEDFVSRLCVPAAQPALLLSGGGDDDVLVWDWLGGGRLVGRASVLAPVQAVVPGASKVAVTRIVAVAGEEGTTSVVFVVCERVPALFCYTLSGTTLAHVVTVSTPGNVLDVVPVDLDSGSPKLLVAVDPESGAEGEQKASILVVERDGASGWGLGAGGAVGPAKEAEGGKAEDWQKLLYSTEGLRKTSDFE
ncbi:hypothetical protein B0T18DRAFT_424635 [Schizothecium vesticola]|uniref:Transfer RNA methyltransferase 82 n=1 Tax=Schizothecium vesticola TaxID=314040 RepID=A0AA40FAF2_9PEZI|nr:hypothetical protein B0T18DRAFT_424635 [Schizothecium vesticola]